MSFLRLAFCIAGVYSMFLLWAIAQERLSVPFARNDNSGSDKFTSALLMGTIQSALSTLSAFAYILARRNSTDTWRVSLGLDAPAAIQNGKPKVAQNGASKQGPRKPSLLSRYLLCSIFITLAAPFGFAALSYISYPAMVLGKSCKLVPVMLMNVVLYNRKFAAHKYLVVAMVTTGITVFMSGKSKPSSSKASAVDAGGYKSLIGMTYLLINLALDGATNSTQDEIFTSHKHVTGQQMMLFINLFCTALTLGIGSLPLPYVPVLHPVLNQGDAWGSELAAAFSFIQTHQGVGQALLAFGITGALGQLFIFETLQHFGSLTLVTITLTRKLFTMLLSVIIYAHPLSRSQWLGAGIVFAGISVEALVKIRSKKTDVHPKKILREEEKPSIKTL